MATGKMPVERMDKDVHATTTMQTLRELRALFEAEGIRPRKRFGQCFLIDRNLMDKLVELAELSGAETVLEVGPAAGSLTEDLLAKAARVVACEIDRDLADLLRRRLGGDDRLTILVGDVLAGKHALSADVLAEVGGQAHLVSNLPYNVATPLIASCLESSWAVLQGQAGACRFDRLTFTVQKEVADRLAAGPGSKDYGPVSVLTALLGRVTRGPIVPATAFWPRPKVASRILRIDLHADGAASVPDLPALQDLLRYAFSQRRKKLSTIVRSRANGPDVLAAATAAGVEADWRPDRMAPAQFAAIAAIWTAGPR